MHRKSIVSQCRRLESSSKYSRICGVEHGLSVKAIEESHWNRSLALVTLVSNVDKVFAEVLAGTDNRPPANAGFCVRERDEIAYFVGRKSDASFDRLIELWRVTAKINSRGILDLDFKRLMTDVGVAADQEIGRFDIIAEPRCNHLFQLLAAIFRRLGIDPSTEQVSFHEIPYGFDSNGCLYARARVNPRTLSNYPALKLWCEARDVRIEQNWRVERQDLLPNSGQNDKLFLHGRFSEFAKMIYDILGSCDNERSHNLSVDINSRQYESHIARTQERAIAVFNLWSWFGRIPVPHLQVVRRTARDNVRVDELSQQSRNTLPFRRQDSP